jgi:16S rRNA (guanine527-N7)-methyltransferase
VALDLLVAGARELGLDLTPRQLEQFETYRRELLAWNERHNLTAITDPAEVERRHFLDSLSCLLAMPALGAASLVDVGAGAGFPGLPLKIVCPEIRLTLVESIGKKSAFLEHAVQALGLRGVRVLTARAEELGQDRRSRERFDWAVARAVASLGVLAEYLLPLVRPGGAMLAMKKGDLTAELNEAAQAIATLGGAPPELIPVTLPGLEDDRGLIVVRKARPTPTRYPRRTGLPARKPIGGPRTTDQGRGLNRRARRDRRDVG